MKLSEELQWRGMVAQNTFGGVAELDERRHKFYLGADPSAASLTIGNLASLMLVSCLARHGYEPTLLIGGATGQIGDPKDTGERDLKSLEEIAKNKKAIVEQFRSVVSRAADLEKIDVVDNYDWFRDINFIDFLRNIGKHFSMTQLLDREFVKARIGEGASGISFAEFSYSLIQGYDFLHLFREKGIDLQVCGADQFGNCASGMHLIKKLDGKRADVWSIPLVIDPVSGKKFGKSEGNAIWLSPKLTTVFDFYQFWLNQSDEAVLGLMKTYTRLMPEGVDAIMGAHNSDRSMRIAQKSLAFGVTAVVHGAELAGVAIEATKKLFDGDGAVSDFSKISDADLKEFGRVLPSISLASRAEGLSLAEALVSAGLVASKGEVRRLITSGAVSVNGVKVADSSEMAVTGVVKVGKNKFLVVR